MMSITFDRAAFFNGVRTPVFNGMSQTQVDGCNSILDAWEKEMPDGDPRHLAYALATAWWETAHTMRPVEEIGHGRGRAYGTPCGPWHQVYYGRGYVQLTWQANYRKATARLRELGDLTEDEDLERDPSLALRPDIAAAVMFSGMTEGWFTGRKLADYIHGNVCDFVNARRIINGLDKAQIIAAAAEKFNAALHQNEEGSDE